MGRVRSLFFLRQGHIPVLFAFTATARPSTTCRPMTGILIDGDGAVKILRLMHPVIAELANLTDEPDLRPGG